MALGIYVHIPFCKAKCNYCDFNSYAGMEEYVSLYCDAIKAEIEKSHIADIVDTIYFGGGTPTVLPTKHLISIYHKIRETFDIAQNCEITIECNPATIDFTGLLALREAGFNRISIGLQSTENAMLKRLGRIHTTEDFSLCLTDAKRAGFENISLDLMYGLPDQTLEQWKNTMEKALSYPIKHISAYALTIEEDTPFGKMDLNLPSEETVREMYDSMVEFFKKNKFERYEISNFAIQGFESRHNIGYWKRKDYIGYGPGAYSCVNGKRYGNILDLKAYCNAILNGKSTQIDEIQLSEEDAMCEFCFLGLRMTEGICCEVFKKNFNKELTDVFAEAIKKHIPQKTLVLEKGMLRITEPWFFVSNSILADFVSLFDKE